jgi:hypothetical protein
MDMVMENRVGDEVPSEVEAMKLVKDIEAIGKRIDKYGVDLSPDERSRALKPPDGSEATTQLMAKLVAKYKLTLPGVAADEMLADLALAQRLGPVVMAIAALERKVQDAVLQANHERWSATTAAYTALVRAMGANPALENELKPAMEFFGVGRKRKPRAPKPV